MLDSSPAACQCLERPRQSANTCLNLRLRNQRLTRFHKPEGFENDWRLPLLANIFHIG